jgi:SIR2-like domain
MPQEDVAEFGNHAHTRRMRFMPNGPDIPAELIAAQEKGETIFVCGAGVSRTVGLPLFRGLIEGIYRELSEDWRLHPAEREGMQEGGELYGQYDRVLRSLERRLAASDSPRNRGMRGRIRGAVRTVLAPPNIKLENHLELLKLSRDAEGRSRLLTTNFDTLFERAWWDGHEERIASHAGPAMPQPKVDAFTGVLHLHGRLADERTQLGLAEETALILTSAEFGDAYLRSGWASRYVYDIVRACTVVMVGYQADDPPMRYLLEALEADRERYPDLQKVFAFVPASAGHEERITALWDAKGVEPILYRPASNEDHSALYETLAEWRRYADDPTAWRREALRTILSSNPDDLDEKGIARAGALLGHGDAAQLLADLSPDPAWVAPLAKRRVFDREDGRLGRWVALRLNDPEMTRSCADLESIDDQSCWFIENALETEDASFSPIRRKAWRLILKTKAKKRLSMSPGPWFLAMQMIRVGETGYAARQLVTKAVKPRFAVSKPIHWGLHEESNDQVEAIDHLVRIDYRSNNHAPSEEILSAWPNALECEAELFRTLNRALADALEESADVGFQDGWDRASRDVPSVARHPQNAYRSRFYPITRVLADLWKRIADKDPDQARTLALAWTETPFLLLTRLHLYTLTFAKVFAPDASTRYLNSLEDGTFWVGDAQVEIMKLITSRWVEFSSDDRVILETRIRAGVPREVFSVDAFDNEEWISVHDNSIFRRLKRIAAIGGVLSADSLAAIDQISSRHPAWVAAPGDRDDFNIWHESGRGRSGTPGILSGIPDDQLVQEAMRLQEERRFEQSDLWSAFCSADPDRALRGLCKNAEDGQWKAEAWRSLLWAAHNKGEALFQREVADLLLQAPVATVEAILPAAAPWLQRWRETLSVREDCEDSRYFKLWDIFATVVYASTDEESKSESEDSDLSSSALGEPGGILAWTLHDSLVASEPARNRGLGSDLGSRFSRAVDARGRSGLLASVFLTRDLGYLYDVDPAWTLAKLVPRLAWTDPRAAVLWQARAQGRVGAPLLFNALKPAFLEIFERRDARGGEFEGLVVHLLHAALWHRQPDGHDYDLSTAEAKKALAVGPPEARHDASRYLWIWVAERDGVPLDKSERWRTVLVPFFREIWPLDARLRDEHTSQNLVLMALNSENSFPEVVEAIIDFVIPYQLYLVAHSLRLERESDVLVRQYPRAFLRLANAIIDPAFYPVPRDLGELLNQCADADPGCRNDPNYIRLFGLSRRQAA